MSEPNEPKPKKPKKAKNTKLTPEREAKIISMIAAGNFKATAAAAAGIHINTLELWLRQGEDVYDADGNLIKAGREPYRSFAAKFREQEALGEVSLVNEVKKGGWKGALAILQRRHPHWQERRRVELANPDGTPMAPAVAPVISIHVNGAAEASPFFDKAPDDTPED